MNVLICAGSTTPASRLSHQLQQSLRKVLSTTYDIKLVTHQILNQHPWQNYTSLVIFPNLEQTEHDALDDNTCRELRQWVAQGGRFLGIGSGARFAGGRLGLLDLTWNQVQSPPNPGSEPQLHREIAIFRRGTSTPLSIDSDKALFTTHVPTKEDEQGLTIWASCRDNKGQKEAAGVWSRYQSGYVVLVGFDISCSNAKHLIEIFNEVGLEGINKNSDVTLEEPSTLHLLSRLSSTHISSLHQALLQRSSGNGQEPKEFQDSQNTFILIADNESAIQNQTSPDSLALVLCPETSLSLSIPLSFDAKFYFSFFDQSSDIGSTVLYGETVASTQTLIEKNSKLGDILPNGTVCIAKRQTNGRGRGTNNWISTNDSIQFSVLVKAENLGSSLVFVQYLFGLAVIEWIEKSFKGKLLVKLKWPNDIYGSSGGKAITDFKKFGGILVNCSFSGLSSSESKLVIGLGLNHSSGPHSSAISLAELIQAASHVDSRDSHCSGIKIPSTEETIAGILNCFGQMWTQFKFQGFQPFMSLYLSHWLHTDQVIKLEKTGERLKILGIDPSFGLLRTKVINDHNENQNSREEQIINLQPDSNSFDMFSGLIKTKI